MASDNSVSEIKRQQASKNESKSKRSMLAVVISSLKMAVATFSSRVLGLVREQVMAALFGASGLTDAFMVAYRVPNMLRDLFAEGAFSSAFVPVFTEARKNEANEARRLMWSLFVLLGLMTTVIAVLIIIFASDIVLLFTDDQFSSNAERLELTIVLTQIMAPFLVFVSLAALLMGALNSLKIFFIPALAPAMFNISMISCMLFFPGYLITKGLHPIYSLGIGVVTGGVFQFLFQVPLIFKMGFGPLGPLNFKSDYIKKILNRIGIGTFGIAATQINILITTVLATSTQLGAVSWLTYAFRLFQFPVGILGVSIAGSNLVHFSDAWKDGDRVSALSFLRSSTFFSFATMIPAMALLMALSQETVALIFERGAFTAQDTSMSAMALRYYLLGLPFYGFYKIFAPTFFILDRPQIPVVISLIAIGCNIVFCLVFTPQYGFQVLALGTSLSMMINNFLQSIMLHRLLKLRMFELWTLRFLKVLIAGLVCFGTTWWLKIYWFDSGGALFDRSGQYLLIILGSSLSYFVALGCLGEAEVWRVIWKRIRRK